jgi:mono/diheme cytochrome c family protein
MLGQINTGVKMGSKICIFDPQRPEDGTKTIFDSEKGFIFDMSLSYDAKKILFSFMDNVKENVKSQKDSFHIWQINVDGSGLQRLTEGPFHDASAVYLPDGRIVFCSTRVQSFSVCQDFLAAAMYIMNGDGSGLRRLEYNTLCDTTPFVMDDGLILFTRWEYQDKNIFCVQGLWTINPAGKRVQLFHGNTFSIPNSVCHARQIPGTRKILCTLAPHHGRPLGAIGIIDRDLGFETVESIVNITPEIPYTPRKGESWNYGTNNSWAPGDAQFDWAYGDPYPIMKDLFLVAYGGPREGGPKRYRLYLLDDKGNKVKIYEDVSTSCYNPVPLRVRTLPHKIPGVIPEPEGEGTFFVSDIYEGLLHKGVKRGQIKQLRIMSQLPKKYNTEGPRYHDHYPIVGQGSYYVKYCYGTVPVYEDGTAYFKAPAGVELYFIALDKDGKEIRRMGTVTQITAGEQQGCVGCHESRFTAAPGNKNLMSRVNREPDSITAPAWGAGPIGFVEQVQPVLDKYCVSCHGGRAPKGRVDLSGGKSRFYNMAYRTLVDRKLVEYYYINHGPIGNFQPFASGSWVSKLTEMIENEHAGVKMDDLSRRRIYNWIDGNAPYYKTWNMSRPHTQGGRDTWHRLKDGKRDKIEDEPWFAEFKKTFEGSCSSCHSVKPEWINLTHPEYSRVLNAHLSKDAGGYGFVKTKDGKEPPVFAGTDDAIYQALLKAIEGGKDALYARPRVDMPGATPIAQERNFGRLY